MACTTDNDGPVLHVIVVGFHHKKGCQVEYSYPPVVAGNAVHSPDLPCEWKHLPSLALPDGAHRFHKDTVYFHMTSQGESNETVYGVSCYRQMDAKDLINRTSDVTRDTVQKSVCVLSKLPLYGFIEAKLELITHAYFKECDFTQVSLLEETYRSLNASLSTTLLTGPQLYCGLPLREVVCHFKHKIILLFKLMLLERKVLFFMSPVKELTGTILALLSLFPGMIDRGLTEAASYSPLKQVSPTLKNVSMSYGSEDFLEIQYTDNTPAVYTELTTASDDHKHSVSTEVVTVSNESNFRNITDNQPADPNCNLEQFPRETVTETVSGDTELIMVDNYYSETEALADSLSKQRVNESSVNRRVVKREHSENDVLSMRRKKGKAVLMPESDNKGDSDVPEKCGPDVLDRSPQKTMTVPQVSPAISIQPILDDVTAVTHPQSVQQMENDGVTSGRSARGSGSSPATSPLQCVEDITAIQSVQNLDHVKGTGIKDLDDPEEIQLIDREDCFSWEEDKLCLEIKDTLDSSSLWSSNTMESIALQSDVSYHSNDPGNDPSATAEVFTDRKGSDLEYREKQSDSGIEADRIPDKLVVNMNPPSPPTPTSLQIDECGLPLSIFTKGFLCHPYLSLQFFDLLQDVNVRGFVIGATNILFKQKRHLTDVIVEVDEPRIDIQDGELKRQLHLTTADLRFAEYIVKSISDEKGDVFLDNTSWEGGADWLRSQFRVYLLSLMSTCIIDDENLIEDFNPYFIDAWKCTHNYKIWRNTVTELEAACTGHPFHGQLSMNDMKLRLSHTIQNTERGKKINAAVQKTGTLVAQTGKVVGGAITQARSAVSSWLSSFTTEKQSPKHSPKLEKKYDDHTTMEQPEPLD